VNEAFWVLTTVVFGIAAGGFAQAWLFARAEVARLKRNRGITGDAAALLRIESAVDAMALDVERVAEHQRYAGRLLAERDVPALPVAGHVASGPEPSAPATSYEASDVKSPEKD